MKLRRAIYSLTRLLLSLAILLAILSGTAFLTQKQYSDYELVSISGRAGSGPGELSHPTGIKIYRNDIFVADSENNRIQVFDLEGRYKRQFGSFGKEPGQFNKPWNLIFVEDELYVAAYQNHRIDVFDPDGTFKRTIGVFGDESSGWGSAASLAIDADSNLVVVDFVDHQIKRMTQEGKIFDQRGTAGSAGISIGKFNYPMDIATSPDRKTIYVADSYNNRVQVFGHDGKYKFKWGGPFGYNFLLSFSKWFPFDGWFAIASAIATDEQGNVYVGDWRNIRVQKFTEKGEFLTSFGAEEKKNATNGVGGIAVAEDGSVFVTDYRNNQIQKWQPTSSSEPARHRN